MYYNFHKCIRKLGIIKNMISCYSQFGRMHFAIISKKGNILLTVYFSRSQSKMLVIYWVNILWYQSWLFHCRFSAKLRGTKLQSEVHELEDLNSSQNKENTNLRRDNMILTDHVADLKSQVIFFNLFVPIGNWFVMDCRARWWKKYLRFAWRLTWQERLR